MIKYPQQSYSTRVCSIALSARSAQIPSNPSTFTRTNVIFHRENWGYSNVIFCLFLMDFQPFPPWRFSSKWCNLVKIGLIFSVFHLTFPLMTTLIKVNEINRKIIGWAKSIKVKLFIEDWISKDISRDWSGFSDNFDKFRNTKFSSHHFSACIDYDSTNSSTLKIQMLALQNPKQCQESILKGTFKLTADLCPFLGHAIFRLCWFE